MLKKIALVTGGTGFVGSHLLTNLANRDWEVHAIARASSSAKRSPAAWHVHDGSTEGLLDLVGHVRPTVVFHLASLFRAQHSLADIDSLVKSNLLFGTQLLEAMSKLRVPFLVNTGTSWQHYEDRNYSPVSLYAATKQAFSIIVDYYVETTPLKAITLKLFDTYGPGDERGKLLSVLTRAAINGERLAMSTGEQQIDLVHVSDVAESFAIAANRLLENSTDENHEQFGISSGAPVTVKQFVSIFEQAAGIVVPVEWGAKPYRPREPMTPWSTSTRLPGWFPRVRMEDSLRELYLASI